MYAKFAYKVILNDEVNFIYLFSLIYLIVSKSGTIIKKKKILAKLKPSVWLFSYFWVKNIVKNTLCELCLRGK